MRTPILALAICALFPVAALADTGIALRCEAPNGDRVAIFDAYRTVIKIGWSNYMAMAQGSGDAESADYRITMFDKGPAYTSFKVRNGRFELSGAGNTKTISGTCESYKEQIPYSPLRIF
jgi:hypothetical protein